MKILLILSTTFLAIVSTPTNAQFSQNRQILIQERLKEACSKPPTINLDYANFEINLNTTTPHQELSLSGTRGHGANLYGLYSNQVGIKTSYKVSEYIIDNESCFYLSNVNFTVTLNPTIYVAREASNYPCMKSKIFEHESQHHTFFMNALQAEHEFLKNELRTRFQNPPVKYHKADVSQLTYYLKDNTEQIQNTFMQRISNRKEPYDKNIDDPKNTQKIFESCGQEVFLLNRHYPK